MNLADFLTDTAGRIPDHTAIYYQELAITFAEMNRKVDALSHGFTRLGIKPGDVCVQMMPIPFCVQMMPSSLSWVLVYYALAKLGAVVVPVNFLFRRRELEYIFQDSGAKAFIGDSNYLDDAAALLNSTHQLKVRIADGEDLPATFIPLNDLFTGHKEFTTHATSADDPLAVIYTSGTTGEPKGAVLTHRSLMSDAIAVADVRHTEANDVVLSVLPLFHIYGMTHSLNISINQGLTIRMWSSFDAQKVLSAIVEEESTIPYAVPTMVNRLVEAAADNPPQRSSLRFVISGGASLPVEVLHRFEQTYHTTIYESYGLTEFSPTCVENPFGRETRPGSIGQPIPPFKTRVVNPNDQDVVAGEVGELCIRGSAVMKEYLNKPEATQRALRGGWLHTGDLARMDEDGYIYIVDRKKDLIIRGGYNVYPREVEEVLYTHNAVFEAAVFGIPHDDLGEEVAAVVVLKPGAQTTTDELGQYVKSQVAPYKYPRVIKFAEVLPKTAAGKILKRAISMKA